MELTVIQKIACGIAVVEGTSPQDLDVALQEWIETDAIRYLVEHERSTWNLEFEVENHEVQVKGDETVLVDGKQRRPSS